jgi:type IV pilus assembly protein PilO
MALTINDLKKLSPKAKAGIIVVFVLLVGYLDYFYFLADAVEKRSSLSKQLEDVQSQIKEKEKIAMQLNKYKADVATLKDSYKIALQKLPDQREIPGLLLSVAQSGRDAGIEFVIFEPKAAVPKALPSKEEQKGLAALKPSDQKPEQKPPGQKPAADAKAADGKKAPADSKKTAVTEPFYDEMPVNVTVTGTFPNIVSFFEKVARLPRIVNISDITMGDRKDIKGRGYVISASCTIKTYMFVDKKESVSDKTK